MIQYYFLFTRWFILRLFFNKQKLHLVVTMEFRD